jgi:hypothetical protein
MARVMFSSGCTQGLDPCPSETGLSKLGVMREPFSQYYWFKLVYLKLGYQCDVSQKLGYLKLGYQSEIVCCFWPKIIGMHLPKRNCLVTGWSFQGSASC